MATTCIADSRNHAMYLTTDSSCCPSVHLFSKFIKIGRPSALDFYSCNANRQYCCPGERFRTSGKDMPKEDTDDHIWLKIRQEAENDVIHEPILAKYYKSAILCHSSLESALAHHLSIKLSDENLSRDALYTVFLKKLVADVEIQRVIRDDLKAVRERDPACVSYVHCLLNFKGFLACQAHRLAHSFWVHGRNVLALVIQSRVSEVFGMDIHPGAKIGCGIVFDHATGVVIGETTVVGNDVTILHNVTLGSTGKVKGDRHPKIGNGVLIGAGAKLLGNIWIGEKAKIGAGSVVLKDVPQGGTAVGNPAGLIGFVRSGLDDK